MGFPDPNQKKKKIQLIPPPPPMTPTVPQGQFSSNLAAVLGGGQPGTIGTGVGPTAPAGGGLGAAVVGGAPPQFAPPAMPQAAPTPMPTFVAPQSNVPPEALNDLFSQAKAHNDLADQLLDKYKTFQTPDVPTPQTSPFENQLNDAMKQRLMTLIQDKPSRLERFNKGMQVGQSVAANIVLPLMGAFNHSTGGAIGLANYTNQLRQQTLASQAQAMAERNAHNSTLANLSSMWENMSPESSRNIMALASAKFKAQHEAAQERNELLKDALQARSNSVGSMKSALQAATGMDTKDVEAAWKQYQVGKDNAQLADRQTRTQEELQNNAANRGFRAKELEQGDKRIDTAQRQATTGEQRLEFDKGQKETDINNRANEAAKQKANEQLMLRLKQFREDAGAVNAQGQPKYPGMIDRVLNNPAELQAWDQMLKASGSTLTSKEMLQHEVDLIKQQQAASSQSGGNFLGIPADWQHSFLGQPGAGAPTRDVLPIRESAESSATPKPAESRSAPPSKSSATPVLKMSPAQAHDAFEKKYGRPPSNAMELMNFAGGN